MKQNGSITAEKRDGGRRRGQWSIMLVGEHGRVIPLRRFKGLVITLMVLAILGIMTLVGLAIMYARQATLIGSLESQIGVLAERSEKLKHERDIYLAKMVIRQEQLAGADNRPVAVKEKVPAGKKNGNPGSTSQTSAPQLDKKAQPVKPDKPVEPIESVKPVEPKPTPVTWGATAKDVAIGYDPVKKVLSVKFKVYNTSRPKKMLSGRCVVVLKQRDDPPLQWLALPRVLLNNGEPVGDTGHAFRIRNYRTIKMYAIKQEAPIEYNIATLHIFTADGRELYQKDHPFSIPYTPPVMEEAVADPSVPAHRAPNALESAPVETDPLPTDPEPVVENPNQSDSRPVEQKPVVENPSQPDSPPIDSEPVIKNTGQPGSSPVSIEVQPEQIPPPSESLLDDQIVSDESIPPTPKGEGQ